MINLTEVLKILSKQSTEKLGLICLNCALNVLSAEKIADFLSLKGVELKKKDKTAKMELINLLYLYYHNQYKKNIVFQKAYSHIHLLF